MRRILLTLLILLAIGVPARAQWPYVPVVQSSVGAGTCAFNNNSTSGNIIVVSSNWETASGTPTVSDTRSTSYSQVILNTSNTVRISIYIGTLGSSGANTVTFSETSAAFQETACAEFPPNWTLTTDVSSVTTFSGTPATVTSGSITTTLNTDLIYTHVGGFKSAGTFVASSSETQIGFRGGSDSEGTSFKVAGVNGSYSSSFSNATNDQGTIAIVAFKSNSIAVTSAATAPDGALSNAYDYTLLAAGGAGAYTWSITSGTLQNGLSLNTSTGEITGTPTSSSSNSVTFQVSDGTHTATEAITIKIGGSLNTITHVQDKVPGSGNGTPFLTFTSNVTSGDMIVATAGYNASGNQVSHCTDTLGTPLQLASVAWKGNPTAFSGNLIYAGIAPSGGSDTVTCGNLSSISEFSNVMYAANDNTLPDTDGSNATPATVTSNNLTTLVPNELLYAAGLAYTSSSTNTVQSPFSDAGPTRATDNGYRVVTTVTTYTASFSYTGNTNGKWLISIAGFRPSAGAATPSTVRHKSIQN